MANWLCNARERREFPLAIGDFDQDKKRERAGEEAMAKMNSRNLSDKYVWWAGAVRRRDAGYEPDGSWPTVSG